MVETARAPDGTPVPPNHSDRPMHLREVVSVRITVPSFHIHIAVCVGDDEDVDISAMFRGWRGRILRRLGFVVADRWALVKRPTEVHIIPIDDGMKHETRNGDCVCGPMSLTPLGDAKRLYTHASLDSREVPPTVADLTP